VTQLREQVTRFARELGEQGRSSALADELVRVEEQLRVRRALLEGIHGGASNNAEGFSPYLSALARQTMQGVWLTGVDIAAAGDLVLKGRVLDGELVPLYIQRLHREPLFKGRVVRELQLATKGEPGKRYLEFSLQIPLAKGAS
jgi:Fimbrial assembly protein (PilN)